MTQEQKELLLKDLCARLPYGVKLQHLKTDSVVKLYSINLELYCDIRFYIYEGKALTVCEKSRLFRPGYFLRYKPYLFPLSSMTDEQKNECFKWAPLEIDKYGDIAVKDDFYGGSQYTDLEIYLEVIDWLNKNHFDYRGLIQMGLAIDATGKNIY